jgi:hypothetical protein
MTIESIVSFTSIKRGIMPTKNGSSNAPIIVLKNISLPKNTNAIAKTIAFPI